MAAVPPVAAAAILSIKDPAIRSVLRSIADNIAVRSGDTGSGEQAFLTLGDLKGDSSKARALVTAIAGPLVDSIKTPGQPLSELADELRDSILASPWWQSMFTRLSIIDAPDTVPGSAAYNLLQEARARGTAITRVDGLIKTANEAIVTTRENLTAKIGENVALINEESRVRADAVSAQAQRITNLISATNNSFAGVEQKLQTSTNNENALAQALNTLWARVGTNQALVQGGTNIVANNVGSAATKFEQLQATVTDPVTGLVKTTAALRQEFNVSNDAVRGMQGKWGVKIDLNGYVTGVSLNSGLTTGGKAESMFLIAADKFAIGAPGKPETVPFAIDARTGLVAVDGSIIASDTISGSALRANSVGKGKIALKAVGGAEIDDLAVTTLKIGNNAVTVPLHMSGYGSSGISVGSSRTVGSISANFPAAVDVVAVVTWQAAAAADKGSNSGVRLNVDGWTFASTSVSNIKGYAVSHCYAARVSLSPGYHSFSVAFSNDWGESYYDLGNWSVLLLGVMR